MFAKPMSRWGCGIGILSTQAFNAERDKGIEARPASDLLPSSTVKIMLRPNTYLRPFLLDFITGIAPSLTPAGIRKAIRDFQSNAD